MPNGASSGSSSGSSASHRLIQGGPGCSATLGRVKNLEMTEYQKEKLINEANTVKIKVKKDNGKYTNRYDGIIIP